MFVGQALHFTVLFDHSVGFHGLVADNMHAQRNSYTRCPEHHAEQARDVDNQHGSFRCLTDAPVPVEAPYNRQCGNFSQPVLKTPAAFKPAEGAMRG